MENIPCKRVIKKLASYKRTNALQSALQQINSIIQSDFMLDYIHSYQFRQNIQTALNRGEAYHRLRKNVAYANEGKIQSPYPVEQHIWSECARLICNAIIYYDTFLLSKMQQEAQLQNNEKILLKLQHISPVAWQHINLHGQFTFQQPKQQLDWKQIIQQVDYTKL